ncbi:MAG: DNA methylase [Eubacteriales bacterium]|nr:DNA methylase [Eubacteriales bacterium]
MTERWYVAIDLKSFYASVECILRGLDPLSTHLVVADSSRTEKTICLAVSPSLKALGIPGRPRLFEVVQKVGEINALRRCAAPGREFSGKSHFPEELKAHPQLAVDYIVAPPRMAAYIDYSTRIYNVYLKYIAPEDIHVYSIDEVMMDVTAYLRTYGLTPRQLAGKIMLDILETTGITATAGIGTNLYLCKVAMDILAKHADPDEHGVRIAELTEGGYRRLLWTHRPLTDFWRIGRGYAKKLEGVGLRTMGDVARCSLGGPEEFHNEELLYKLFGVNAQLLIDHAWGFESCTMADIKAYRPSVHSLSSGQVLSQPYRPDRARLVVREMADALSLDLVGKGLVADQLTLTIGYDMESLKQGRYAGPLVRDPYGRAIPRHAHGSENLGGHTASTARLLQAVSQLYDRIVDPGLLVRRITVTACHVIPAGAVDTACQQLDLFADPAAQQADRLREDRERRRQGAILTIRGKYGKNAIVRAMSLEQDATAIARNAQIGGHKA